MNAFLQSLIVALLLGWSLFVMLRRFFPAPVRALRHRLAAVVAARGSQRLARWLRRDAKAASGCDNGCSSCRNGCSTPLRTQPVQWRSPSSTHSLR